MYTVCADKVNIHSLNFTEHLLSATHGATTGELLVNRTDTVSALKELLLEGEEGKLNHSINNYLIIVLQVLEEYKNVSWGSSDLGSGKGYATAHTQIPQDVRTPRTGFLPILSIQVCPSILNSTWQTVINRHSINIC